MTTLDINVGDIFELPEGRFRFLEEWDDCTLWFLKDKTAKRLPLSEAELIEMLDQGTARRVDIFRRSDGKPKSCNDMGDFGPGEEFSPDAIRARTLRFYVRTWDETRGASLGKAGLAKFIAMHREAAYKKLLTHDVKPARLYDAIVNCGEPGNRPLRVFRSRRGKSSRQRFVRPIEEAIKEIIDFYWDLRARTFTDAYARFRELIKNENDRRRVAGERPLGESDFPRRPETLRRRVNATINYDNWARKYGQHEATLKFVGTKDSPTATSPLELVIMDHTVIDTWVVFDTEQFLPLGRPTLTVAIDVATRMVLGYLISFEPPSLYSVLTTLKRVIRSKDYVRHVFPEVDFNDGWDGWGLPKTLLVDSAWEFKSPSFQDSLRDVGIEPIWSPVRRPQYKAIGERFFKTLNDRLFHKLPGAVPFGPTEMRLVDIDPKKDAVLSLGSLDELMHHTIIAYHNEEHSSLGEETPAQAWKRKLKKRHVISDVRSLDHLLGQTAKVRLTRRGIRFKNMTFHDEPVTSRLMDMLVAKAPKRDQPKSPVGSGRSWVKIRYNPIDASCIQVWNDAAKPPRFETLRNRDRRFVFGPQIDGAQRDPRRELPIPISFWHAEKVLRFAKEKNLPIKTDEQRWIARSKLRAFWERIAGLLPMRETKEAVRGLAQSQGTFDHPSRQPPGEMKASDILFATADPSTSGMGAATLVPEQVAAFERGEDERFAPKARGQSQKAKAKTKRTLREKAEAAAEERGEQLTEAVKRRLRQDVNDGHPKFTDVAESDEGEKMSREEINKWLDKD
jgi:putative transposase